MQELLERAGLPIKDLPDDVNKEDLLLEELTDFMRSPLALSFCGNRILHATD